MGALTGYEASSVEQIDALITDLGDSPMAADIYEASLPYSERALAAVAAKRAGAGGGGSQTSRGARVYLTADQLLAAGSDSQIYFDDSSGAATEYDTDGFMSQNQGNFIIPAGLGGLYILEAIAYIAGDAAMASLFCLIDEPSNSCDITPVQRAADDEFAPWTGSGCFVRKLAEGDAVRLKAHKSAPSQVTARGDGGNLTSMSITYLGPLAT